MLRSRRTVDYRHPGWPLRANSGFSLVELMTVIAIIGILSGLAAPAVRDWATNQRLKTTSFDIIMTMMLARSESTKRGRSVYVKKNTDPGGTWTDGWCIVTVASATCPMATLVDNVGADVAATENILRVFPVPKTVTVENSNDELMFSLDGRLAQKNVFEVKTEDSSSDARRCVTVYPTGVAKATSCLPL